MKDLCKEGGPKWVEKTPNASNSAGDQGSRSLSPQQKRVGRGAKGKKINLLLRFEGNAKVDGIKLVVNEVERQIGQRRGPEGKGGVRGGCQCSHGKKKKKGVLLTYI